MQLKLGNFYVKDVVFGSKTFYENGILTINKEEALNLVKRDKRVTKCDLVIVKPGEMVRLVPVKAITEARCKVTEGNELPGYFNPVAHAGEGVTHCLKGMSVMTVGKYGSFASAVLDMGGKGAEESLFSKFINVCLLMEGSDVMEEIDQIIKQDESHHLASVVLAKYLGETVRNLIPDECDEYDFDPVLKRGDKLDKLPKVAYVLIAESNGEQDYMNQLYYGWPMRNTLPFLVSPTMILDGALAANQYHVGAMGKYNINEINNPIVKRLFREHGKTINFVGVIVSNNSADLSCKERSIMMTVELCRMLGIDGATVTMTGYGNTYLDYIETCAQLNQAGIIAAGLSLEVSGRDGRGQPFTIMNPDAKLLVSTGNVSEVVELPPMETVYGDIETIIRDPSSGSWIDDDIYGPSLREDGSIVLEENYICGGCNSLGFTMKTVKEF